MHVLAADASQGVTGAYAPHTSAHVTAGHGTLHGIVGPNGDGLTVGFAVGVAVGVTVGVGVAVTLTGLVSGLVLAA